LENQIRPNVTKAARSTKHDQFIQEQLQSIPEPGEQVLHTCHVWRGLSVFVNLLLTGPIGMLLWRHYYAIAIDDLHDVNLCSVGKKTEFSKVKMHCSFRCSLSNTLQSIELSLQTLQ